MPKVQGFKSYAEWRQFEAVLESVRQQLADIRRVSGEFFCPLNSLGVNAATITRGQQVSYLATVESAQQGISIDSAKLVQLES